MNLDERYSAQVGTCLPLLLNDEPVGQTHLQGQVLGAYGKTGRFCGKEASTTSASPVEVVSALAESLTWSTMICAGSGVAVTVV